MQRFDQPKISGTKMKNRVLVASTGTASLDSLLGDGAPNTTLIVVDEENGSRKFFPPIARCFLAEGLAESQTTVCASVMAATTSQLIEQLPQIVENSASNGKEASQITGKEDLDFRIAWRYSTMPKVDSSIRSSGAVNKFDLSRKWKIDAEALKRDGLLHVLTPSSDELPTFASIWDQLHKLMTKMDFTDQAPESQRKFLRILLPDVSSPLWTDPSNLPVFLIRFKAFCRKLNCIAMICIDSSIMTRKATDDILRLADAFIRLEFIEEETRKSMSLHQKFDGRLYVLKLPTIFSAAPHRPDCLDLIFNLKRTHFDVKIFHLPPAVGSEESSNAAKLAQKSLCQKVQDEF